MLSQKKKIPIKVNSEVAWKLNSKFLVTFLHKIWSLTNFDSGGQSDDTCKNALSPFLREAVTSNLYNWHGWVFNKTRNPGEGPPWLKSLYFTTKACPSQSIVAPL